MRLQEPLSAKEPEAVSEETVVTEAKDLPARLPGINIENALKSLNIDKNIFKDILIGFLSNNRDTDRNIRKAYESRDWKLLMQLAHSLKGSSANIGAKELQEATYELEKASRDSAVKPPALFLIEKVEAALKQVQESLQSLAGTIED